MNGAPKTSASIEEDAAASGFAMSSEVAVGSLLRALVASKPGGRFLELGTGAGAGTAWLLDGMDDRSQLHSVESDENVLDIARRHLGDDTRVTFELGEAARFLADYSGEHFDLVYADTWAGKFTDLDAALNLVAVGGFYVVDDLLPQPSWPEGHAAKVPDLIADLSGRADFVSVELQWSSGLMVLVRVAEPS